jgi:DNA-binding beta-propeller fold protein YncE
VHRNHRRAVAALTVSVAAIALTATAASAYDNGPVGTVYTLSNAPSGNAVLAYARAGNGHLTPAGSFPTGGAGSGSPLGSQGALVLAPGGRELFAVNAASNSVSAFRVRRGGLELEEVVPSGGEQPISLTIRGNRLFVLNAGGAGNISGFDASGHGLEPIPGATRALSAGAAAPAEVAYSPDGRDLVVTEKASNTIDVFAIGRHGLPGPATAYPSAGHTPFGFAFDQRGHLLVSEASGSASSYALDRHDVVTTISGPVSTSGQGAPCWLVVTEDGRFAFTANAGAGTISAFRVGRDGVLTLRDANGITANLGAGSHPLDEAITSDGKFLYNLTDGQHALTALAIGRDGSLVIVGTTAGLPVGATGLAAS